MFWDQFTNLCANNETTPTQVITQLHLSMGSVTHWKNGKVPRHETLLRIADHFGVSVDYLLGNTDKKEKPTVNDDGLSEGQRELIEFAKSVPEDKIDLILKLMKSIVEAP